MKILESCILILLILTCSFTQAQMLGINYQGIARNSNGEPLASQPISLRISLSYDAIDGTLAYREVHDITTNQFGLFALVVGTGTPQSGVYTSVDWKKLVVWMSVEMDSQGGTNYQLIGGQQLQAVPYAKYAETTSLQAGSGISISGTTITNASPDKTVTLSGVGTITTSGAYPNFQITGNPQDLQLVTDELKITSNPGATPIDLSPYKQTLSVTNSADVWDLIISNGNTIPLDLSAYKQTLSAGNTGTIYDVGISDGNQIQIDVADNDNDPVNEIQNLQQVLNQANDAGNNTITNLPAPVLASDAATKQYVDDGDADYAFKTAINFSMAGTANEPIDLMVPDFDQGSVIQTNKFIALVSGVYIFYVDGQTGNTLNTRIKFVKNSGTSPQDFPVSVSINANTSLHNHKAALMLQMDVGETLELQVISGSSGAFTGAFFGYKL